MSFENIQEAVLETAKGQADLVMNAARKAADAKLRAFRESETQAAERQYQSAIRAIEEEYSRILIQRKGVANKALLAKRNECLARVFAKAQETILAGMEGRYSSVMRTLLERATRQTGGQVRVHSDERPVFAGLIAELNKSRVAGTTLLLDEETSLPVRGGFVLVAKGYEIDQTLGTLLADIEREMVPEIAAELFA